ncbi:MAG: hypothetical protein A2836_02435 [Candidatus Taylorbacteria bacterium RIFCSPHIGHO2_01_FULL_45_63]|uniref:Uncharacterized protein n=1 Tax=Candidatus Taylorbacteria bacterium RIFCSPHIGHO2_02_FULL_45_35 TaxID=1802311 RepID=A0A1G2MUK6_9BACT|nr:MAG: hypothetical protein A2836_02435 [Candidatus Taylorbacteria bacterium RIFCSPHIGHO2_01_FULL_45_63]OHA26939.1 MAG: hypothetical protein A3D56_00735 [Candidatus Taylorbacteria bacterium RIFCSPHIGHO2_02_FULL_45_35]OHA33671.1 MAG: hypothetical protein A3A22_03675 [Candidatus Taylorbacteria bacterium RIFCSPLOWO2_01_FULL_45_34b]
MRMESKNTILSIIGAVVLIGIVILIIFKGGYMGGNNPEPVYCAMDAKLCPDGSYVGRVPPSCAFAACPGESGNSSQPQEISIESQIGKEVRGLGVTILPQAVLEDSRCPIDVECIQAGTVRVRTFLTSGLGQATQVFTLGELITTEAEIIELVGVLPVAKSGKKIDPADYRFTFKITKRSASSTYPFDVKG